MLTQINNNSTIFDYKTMNNTTIKCNRQPTTNQNNTLAILPLETTSASSSNYMHNGLIEMNAQMESLDLTRGIFLFDAYEKLLISSVEEFLKALKIAPHTKIKVVSIFGNTGEGKSYTLNHLFFDGVEMFRTSPHQQSCTLGVWAMYDPKLNVICLDTEGMLGVSTTEHQRTRLLLKILAVSDIIIYRTKAERLHIDLYKFLGGASCAYKDHFSHALQQVVQGSQNGVERSASVLGPAVIIFHETTDTNPLETITSESPEDIIRSNFAELKLDYDSYSSIKYVGIKRNSTATPFLALKMSVQNELKNSSVRSHRNAEYVYLTLKGLNEKFQSQISTSIPHLYLSAFFTCQDKCESCKATCTLSMGHKDENKSHFNDSPCKLQHQYQNFVYICKKCKMNGTKEIVNYQSGEEQYWGSILTTVWSGDVINCPNCGPIYQSRKHWYGNKDPTDEAVVMEIVHVWPGDKYQLQEKSLFGTQNTAQKVVDSVTSITNVVASIGSQPTKIVADWVTDTTAPSYWRPNNEILECHNCRSPLTSNTMKHHCRACGEGFCDTCLSKTQPVPARGWKDYVRVCDSCYGDSPISLSHLADDTEVRARKVVETVNNSITMVKSVIDISMNFIKDSARPSYWTPDNDCIECVCCRKLFGPLCQLHHCRDCGKGVCDECSNNQKPVPLRGWHNPVRICDRCSN